MNIKKVNLKSEVDKIKQHWMLKDVANVNDHVVRIAKLKGDFEMHKHENGEKLFYIIEGTMGVEFSDGDIIEAHSGEFVVIPKGVSHKPFAKQEVCVMLFEPK